MHPSTKLAIVSKRYLNSFIIKLKVGNNRKAIAFLACSPLTQVVLNLCNSPDRSFHLNAQLTATSASKLIVSAGVSWSVFSIEKFLKSIPQFVSEFE
ncbi:MAG: hypothetical protein NT070_18385 [Cyanobacteria bacterium]|nr:hypothetical protein [Cyanobacteriota bacterium]